MEEHNMQSYHFAFAGSTNFKQVLALLEANLPYYRLSKSADRTSKEIFYDGPNDVLSEAGIILSKHIENNKASLTVRKLSQNSITGKQSKKFLLGNCALDEEPSDFSFKIASTIVKLFNSTLSIDLDSLVKQTMPKMDVVVQAEVYDIICGTGYRGIMQHERSIYRDINKGKKVEISGVTFQFPTEDRPEKKEILDAIDRYVKGLSLLQLSRFELGCKYLYPPTNAVKQEIKDDDEDDDEEDED